MNTISKVRTVAGVFLIALSAMIIANIVRYNLPPFLRRNNINIPGFFKKEEEIPARLTRLLRRNPETEDFVTSYLEEKGKIHNIDLSAEAEAAKEGKVPLFLQWDKRWGYERYSGEYAALSACGPVVMSMAAIFYFEDDTYTPIYMMEWATKHGYATAGSGSLHSLIYDGGQELGMVIQEIGTTAPPYYLDDGNPVICLMGPGDFTTTGHFIILTGYTGDIEQKDGTVTLNDPNSLEKSGTEYSFDRIKDQIKRAWRVMKY